MSTGIGRLVWKHHPAGGAPAGSRPRRAQRIRNGIRAALKLLVVNVLVMMASLFALELGYRGVKFVASCIDSQCERSYWAVGNKFRRNTDIDLSRDDAVLGHVPNDGDYVIPGDSAPITVTIRDGVRVNAMHEPYTSDHSTLAVGDSFTFGDEVSDGETWPACLEGEWDARVVNGGVFGYGGAQAVLRAGQLESRQPFDRVIWSILVGHDFERDRLVARSNALRPAVVSGGAGLRYTSIEESQRVFDETIRTGIAKYADHFGHFYLTKLIWQHFSRYMLPAGAHYDGRWNVEHPDAATLEEVMTFALDQFAALHAGEKHVLLQYPKDSVAALSREAADEVGTIRQLSLARDIQVIDSLPALQAVADRESLYQRHHTPAGNRAVCQSIVAALAKPQATGLASGQHTNRMARHAKFRAHGVPGKSLKATVKARMRADRPSA